MERENEKINHSESHLDLSKDEQLRIDEVVKIANSSNLAETKRLLRIAIKELDFRGQLSL